MNATMKARGYLTTFSRADVDGLNTNVRVPIGQRDYRGRVVTLFVDSKGTISLHGGYDPTGPWISEDKGLVPGNPEEPVTFRVMGDIHQTIKPIDVDYEDVRRVEEAIIKRDILAEDPRWVLNRDEIEPEMEAVKTVLKHEAEYFFKKYAA